MKELTLDQRFKWLYENAAELYCNENNLIFEIIYQNGNKKN